MAISDLFSRLTTMAIREAKLIPETRMKLTTIVDGCLVCADGSVGTMLRLQGLRTMKAISNFDGENGFTSTLARRLLAAFSVRGHAVQFYFQRDPSYAKRVAEDIVRPSRNAAAHFDLDLERHFDMKEEMLAKRIMPELSYVVLWTRPAALDPEVLRRMENTAKYPPAWPRMESAQDVFRYTDKMVSIHKAWVDDVLEIFKQMEISAPKMDGHSAFRAIRSSPRPGFVNPHWAPWLPGDEMAADQTAILERSDLPVQPAEREDISGGLWPNMVDQVFDGCSVEVLSGSNVRIGNTVWASVQMALGPLDQQPFARLVRQIGQSRDLPWRASFTIETRVLARMRVREFAAQLGGATSKENTKPLFHALKAARVAEGRGRAEVGIQAIFSTWASTAELKQDARVLEDRENRLRRAVESWGRMQVDDGGDPFELTMGSMLGISPVSPAVRTIAPLKNALTFLPFDRDASAMEQGSLTFLSEDDTVFSWDEGSKLQLSCSFLVAAPPGSGKSSLLSSMCLAFMTAPTSQAKMKKGTGLPFLGVIDIGFSQRGCVNTVREALPRHRIEEAQYHRLHNEARHAINPMDTQPGFRHPTADEHAFLVNFFTLLITPIGQDEAPPLLAELAAAVISQAYRSASDIPSDKGTPKKFNRGYDPEADELIEKYGIQTRDGKTTWWEIVDALHAVGTPQATNAAIFAQRNAVPLIGELGTIVNSPVITQQWGSVLVPGSNQRLIDLFLASLTFVGDQYPMLSCPTRFHLGQGRFVVLDLGHIASGVGPFARRMTAVSYMLGRFVLARGFYLTDEIVNAAPPNWKKWHADRVSLYREAPKRLVYDEFHETRKAPGVRDQVVTDKRTGRKWGVEIGLISQSFLDFDDEMFEMATSNYVLGMGDEAGLARVRERYSISERAAELLRDRLTGPGRHGSPFLAFFKMKDGRHEHYLFNIKTAYELWTDSTTPDDMAVRDRLAKKIGYVNACFTLAKRFKAGSAQTEIAAITSSNPGRPATEILVDLAEKDYYRELEGRSIQ